MSNYYSSNPKLYVGIDCIIFGFNEGELNLLLLKRNFEPAMGEWSLMGGFVQEDESVDDAAKRVLRDLTGLKNVDLMQFKAFGSKEPYQECPKMFTGWKEPEKVQSGADRDHRLLCHGEK